MRALGGVLVLVVALMLGPGAGEVVAAQLAEAPVTCPPGTAPHPVSGQCIIIAPVPDPGPDPVPAPDPGDGGGGGGSGGGSGPQVCQWIGGSVIEVPCTSAEGYYSNERQCYIKALEPQPPATDPVWEGRTEGAIYRCTPPYWFDIGVVPTFDFWAAATPAGPAAPPDPRVLAEQAIAVMDLSAIQIGIVPEPGPDSVGLVGMPVWMWVDDPAANTWGPITRSASAAGYTVTATAQVSQVVWDMGDGAVVRCAAGTVYEDRFGKQDSPTCGHTYTTQGEYQVAATSTWQIDWSGIGQSGTIQMDLTRTTPVTIGEAQVLRQR